MLRGVLEADEGRVQPGGSVADEFARSVRQFALDARDVLERPDSTPSELIELQRRAVRLLREVPGARTTGIAPWLLAVRQRIGARLQSWSMDDPASSVA
jgi:hypothetical protein